MSKVKYCAFCGRAINKSPSKSLEEEKKRWIVHLKCFEQFKNQITLNKLEEEKELQEK